MGFKDEVVLLVVEYWCDDFKCRVFDGMWGFDFEKMDKRCCWLDDELKRIKNKKI